MAKEEAQFPRCDSGYFHLTPKGWVRKDIAPFPEDRCETWLYEMEWPAEDAKEQVILTKIWVSPNFLPRQLKSFGRNSATPSRPAASAT